jgi:hypothetical protein
LIKKKINKLKNLKNYKIKINKLINKTKDWIKNYNKINHKLIIKLIKILKWIQI